MDKEVILGPSPGLAIGGKPAPGHQIVDMGMILQLTRPRLQYPDHADLSAHKTRVKGELLQRLCRGAKEQVVDPLLVTARDGAQTRRQRKGDQEVGGRQQ